MILITIDHNRSQMIQLIFLFLTDLNLEPASSSWPETDLVVAAMAYFLQHPDSDDDDAEVRTDCRVVKNLVQKN